MSSPQERGREFEREISDELGLETTPASGATWWSKLDLKGVARWSLKYTDKSSFRITTDDIDEAVGATKGISGDGRTPIWLIRINSSLYDMVLLRKEDFLAMQRGEIKIHDDTVKVTAGDKRRARSKVPVLLREEEDGTN